VIGKGQKQITTAVGIADIDLVKKGDRVTVTVDGVTGTLSGTVGLVGIMNTSGTSGTTTTYPATVLLDRTGRALYDGAGATVAIQVGTKQHVLTVPISAVHRSAFGTTVDVYAGGKVTATPVQTGIRGVGDTEITSGLRAGQQVVLAVVSDPVPSGNSASSVRRGAGLLSGTGGAARFAGGARGGR
jgi:trimeric autotransporter adhesin